MAATAASWMKVVVAIATIDPEHGGPARTVPALCSALAETGANVELVTIAERGRRAADLAIHRVKTSVIETHASRYQPQSWGNQFKQALGEGLRAKDAVLYDVGLWLPSNHFASQVATKTRTAFVVSPRGMLSNEALKVSRWKKRIAWTLYQRRDLNHVRVLHATSEAEAKDFRSCRLSQSIAIVPNGVEVPKEARQPTTDPGPHMRTVLFLSRIHPIKGLKDLVQAWARIRPNGWRLVVAGPNENNHQREIESLAESLRVRDDFEFVGPASDAQKWKLLSDGDLFVLPSYSESFGMAIAEAMAAGVPVITTKATPWEEIERHRCGWWVNTGVDSITTALGAATACDSQELRAMGERGRDLVQKKYSWESAAKNLLSVFEWILERSDKPACIV